MIKSPYTNESPMSEEDMEKLSALVQSPIFGVLKRLMNVQRGRLFSELVEAHELAKIADLQGQIKGINLVENLPIVMSETLKKIKEKREKKTSNPSRRSEAGTSSLAAT